jgi:hypothetical protein
VPGPAAPKHPNPPPRSRPLVAPTISNRKKGPPHRGDPSPAPLSQKGEQKANREAIRLETLVTHRKQKTGPTSNREKEACFSSRGGCFSPPAVRPRRRRRVLPAEIQIHPARRRQDSNRECIRLENDLTYRKQTTHNHSNREKEACFSDAVGEGVHHPPGLGLGVGLDLGGTRGIGNTHCHTGSPPGRALPYAEKRTPIGRKNRKWRPSFMFRLKTTPILCFVGVTENFNRTMFRLKQPVKRRNNEQGGG